jgi:excisionase family DNA binding protein
MDAEVTLQEAADALGVHYMTAYRYVRLGQLPARKAGATWRVRVVDVEALRDAPKPRPGRKPRAGSPGRHWAERLEARLLAGDASGAAGVLDAALAAGLDIDGAYLDVLAPAMARIGDRWAAGELDVADEHRSSALALEVMARLAPRFRPRGRTRGSVVLGAAPGERHRLPVSILADLVRCRGFAVDNLGADVPAASFATAAGAANRLVAVGVSVTVADHLAGAGEAIAGVRGAVGDGVAVLVGGAAVTSAEVARSLGADHWAADGRMALDLLEGLAPRRT